MSVRFQLETTRQFLSVRTNSFSGNVNAKYSLIQRRCQRLFWWRNATHNKFPTTKIPNSSDRPVFLNRFESDIFVVCWIGKINLYSIVWFSNFEYNSLFLFQHQRVRGFVSVGLEQLGSYRKNRSISLISLGSSSFLFDDVRSPYISSFELQSGAECNGFDKQVFFAQKLYVHTLDMQGMWECGKE